MADKKKPDEADKPAKKADGDSADPSWVDQEPFVPPPAASATAPKSDKKQASKSSAGSIEPKVQVAPEALATDDDEPTGGKSATSKSATSKSKPAPKPRSYTSTPSEYDPGEDTDPGPSRRRFMGLPGWGWLLVICTVLGVLLLTCDLRNRNRYRMVCSAHKVSLKKGRTLPLPFGEETIGGAEFKPVEIPPEADCRTRVYHSQEEAELGFLEFILDQVRTALDNPGTADLNQARKQVEQAMILVRRYPKRRRDAEKMLAELSYREGRSGLARVENELRKALASFQTAQKHDGERWEDLDDWITHLEDLLRDVAPSPGTPTPRRALPLPTGPSRVRRPLAPPAKGTRPLLPPASAPSTTPDAGASSTGGGILM